MTNNCILQSKTLWKLRRFCRGTHWKSGSLMRMEPPSFPLSYPKEQRVSAAPQTPRYSPRRFTQPVLSKITVLVLMLVRHYSHSVAARCHYQSVAAAPLFFVFTAFSHRFGWSLATDEIFWRIFSNLFCRYLFSIIVHAHYLMSMSQKCEHQLSTVRPTLTVRRKRKRNVYRYSIRSRSR